MCKEKVVERFRELQRKLKEVYPDVDVALCELLGRRWSFVEGGSSNLSPFVKRIKVTERFGISIFYENSKDNLKEIIDFIRGYFNGDFFKETT
ncbi:hypothetical protein GFV12_00750 [Desulfurobacterium thermolithotrophum]|uniref:hypothetical protein n=1 Tax=Desulfurobacterium thermolithotrophum TaxID=64160 RepID=UPI0013CFC104|nr:hypothetical protein [Desulfurobacterium thermolithotrophum]